VKTKVKSLKKSSQGLSKRKPLNFLKDFQSRKQDHIQITLDKSSQYQKINPLDKINLKHSAFPEMDWSELDISSTFLKTDLGAPFFISSMTAGHEQGQSINLAFAELSAEKKILMGVGSQRRELSDETAKKEWKELRRKNPGALLLSNIGLSQLIHTPVDKIIEIIENLEAVGVFIHVNPLQEALQKEGTPQFKGGLKAIEKIAKAISVPVIIKEVGNGFSAQDMQSLNSCGIFALDLSAKGGTDWARVESLRYQEKSAERHSGLLFSSWGYSLPEMILFKEKLNVSYQTWGSGGIRSGLDIAKVIALGCEKVGLAQPWLEALLPTRRASKKLNQKALFQYFDKLEKELKVAMFCTGSKNLRELQNKKVIYVTN